MYHPKPRTGWIEEKVWNSNISHFLDEPKVRRAAICCWGLSLFLGTNKSYILNKIA
jgi:hypothetical protein